MNNVKTTYVAAHFNTAAQANIPAYWTPAVFPTDQHYGNRIWPCDTEAEAVELGEELIRSGVASADVGAEA
jgi:hypothetical protein